MSVITAILKGFVKFLTGVFVLIWLVIAAQCILTIRKISHEMTWRDVGYIVGALEYGARRGSLREMGGAMLYVLMVISILGPIVDDTKGALTRRRPKKHDWPELPAIEKHNMHLPTEYPFKREKAKWPPFTGVRKALGEQ